MQLATHLFEPKGYCMWRPCGCSSHHMVGWASGQSMHPLASASRGKRNNAYTPEKLCSFPTFLTRRYRKVAHVEPPQSRVVWTACKRRSTGAYCKTKSYHGPIGAQTKSHWWIRVRLLFTILYVMYNVSLITSLMQVNTLCFYFFHTCTLASMTATIFFVSLVKSGAQLVWQLASLSLQLIYTRLWSKYRCRGAVLFKSSIA